MPKQRPPDMSLKQFVNSPEGALLYRTVTGLLLALVTVAGFLVNDKLTVLKAADESLRRIEQQIAAFTVAQVNVQRVLEDHDKRLGKLEDWRNLPQTRATP